MCMTATEKRCCACNKMVIMFPMDEPFICYDCDPTISKEMGEPFAIRTENPRWSPAFSTEAYNKR